MSPKGEQFAPLFPAQAKRPASAFFGAAKGSSVRNLGRIYASEKLLTNTQFIRDQFTISTWLCIGGVIQGALILALGRLALLPAVAVLLYRTLDTYAMVIGFKKNIYMKDVITQKFSAQIPDEIGEFGSQPANAPVTVFIIGTRSNHPLGMLAPGFKELGDHFQGMAKDLEKHAEEYGFLGMTTWLNASVRATSSELQQVAYFRSYDGLHAFAHSEIHRKAWDWWNRTVAQHPHLAIYHETYDVPAGHWETIYANSHPSGLGTATFKITDDTGSEAYASSIVDASRGKLKSSAGRMNRASGDDNDKYEQAKY